MRLAPLAAVLVALAAPAPAQTAAVEAAALEAAGLEARAAVEAATPDLGKFYLEDAVDAAFDRPVAVAFAPGGRMFVVEKAGVVRVVQHGVLQPEPFVDLRDEVLDQHDRGMLGIAVDPRFEENHRVYLAYTVDHGSTADAPRLDAFARVVRYSGRSSDPNRAVPGSRTVLLGETFETGIPACYYSHSIGTLAFGADGTLLVGAGDGASYDAVDAGGLYDACFGPGRLDPAEDVGAFRSQRLESLAGKILRIDPRTGQGLDSNPFWTGDPDAAASKVWALGVRNPFRFAIDPRSGREGHRAGRPGTLYVADVGWSTYDELDVVRGGENLGWPCVEGPAPNPGYQGASPATNGCDGPTAGALTGPTFYWHHADPGRSRPAGRVAHSLAVGALYLGSKYPAYYQGALFYGDVVDGWMVAATVNGAGRVRRERLFGEGLLYVVDAAYDPESEYLYLVDMGSGRVRRVRHQSEASTAPPVAAATASPSSGGLGGGPLRVQFSPHGSASPDGGALAYAWDFGDGTGSAERAPVHEYAAPGVYAARLTVTNAAGSAEAAATVTVRAGHAPRVRIVSPTAVTRAAVGRTVRLEAHVEDADQPAGELFVRWTVEQVHNHHVHPDVFQADDVRAHFTVPDHGVPGEVVYYRVTAEVRDATGLTARDEAALFLEGDPGEVDVTASATPRASVEAPAPGRGAESLSVLTDGVRPGPGAAAARQYATFTGARDRATDWVGLEWPDERSLSRVTVQPGLVWPDGGWFEAPPRVQVRRDGEWVDVTGPSAAPGFDPWAALAPVEVAFAPARGDAVRVVGPPGGAAGFVTTGEVRAWAVREPTRPVEAPWALTGVDGAPAEAWRSGTAVEVRGGGRAWGTADRFALVHRALDGDGALEARVEALSAEPAWAKAILTFRASTAPGAPHVSVLRSNLGVHVQARLQPDGPTVALADAGDGFEAGWLRLERAGTTVTARASTDGASWETLATVEVQDPGAPILAGLGVSDDGAGTLATARFSDVALETPLPAGWASADVGAVAAEGAAASADGAFVLTGNGDVWGAADRFRLASRAVGAGAAVEARVEAPVGPWAWSKAGVMVRASDAPGAPHAFLFLSGHGVRLQVRPEADGPSHEAVADAGASGPLWLRLERSGPTVTAFRSDDGASWVEVGTAAVPGLGGGPALGGLAVSSGAGPGEASTAEGRFSGVAVTDAPAHGRTASAAGAAFGLEAVFPNPARGRATVRLGAPAGGTLSVVDALGRRVLEAPVEAGAASLALDLGALAGGVYVVRLADPSGRVEARPLVVAR